MICWPTGDLNTQTYSVAENFNSIAQGYDETQPGRWSFLDSVSNKTNHCRN